MPNNAPQQFILLPPRGLSSAAATTPPATANFFTRLETVRTTRGASRAPASLAGTGGMKVLDSIHENGAKLVEMSSESVSALRAAQPGLRIVPVVYYYPARAPRPQPAATPKKAAAALKITLTIVAGGTGKPVAGAKVVAFTDFAQRIGAEATSNKQGKAALALGSASKKIERLYVYAENGFWNALLRNTTLTTGTKVALRPITLPFEDCLRHFYGDSQLTAGAGVTVGVIDTGVGPHDLLNLQGGENTVSGEDPKDFLDNGEGHGTHVAGIIAARGSTPAGGVRGVAPGVTLRSYRVFGKNAEGASNFAIAKAIDRAVSDGCDLLNMSLGGGPKDEATHSAVADARARGALVLVATGNDGRQPVSFPASDSLAIAVSALGRKGTFPADTTEVGDVAPPTPTGKDKQNFIAEFSNVGNEVDLTGPGVGIISTFPGNKLAVMDGTSMACPAATGAAARLLASKPALLGQPRTQARSDAMAQAVLAAAKRLGFPATLEGQGLIAV